MNRLTVALLNPETNNFSVLPPSFHESDNTIINIHHSPLIEVNGTMNVSTNFDLFIDLSYNKNEHLEIILENKYLHVKREPKSLQTLKMLSVCKKEKLSIIIPRIYKTFLRDNIRSSRRFLSDYSCELPDKVLVKLEDGARGIGHVVIESRQLDYLLDLIKTKTSDELKQIFPSAMFGKMGDSEYTDTKILNSQNLVVTEFIPDIKSELRVLYNGKDFYAIERDIVTSETNYRQANLDLGNTSIKSVDTIFTLEDLLISKGFISNQVNTMLSELTTLVQEINFKFGSMDIFIDSSHRMGVIEYCNQFGFYGKNPNFIRQFHQDFIIKSLKDAGFSV